MHTRDTEAKTYTKPNIEDIIKEAKKDFVPGNKISKDFTKRLLAESKKYHGDHENYYNPETDKFSGKPEAGYKKILFDNRYPYLEDNIFSKGFNANRIEGTNFIASAGPENNSDLDMFLANTAFHPTMPINRIVALGNKILEGSYMHNQNYIRCDFSNYALADKDTSHFTTTVETTTALSLKKGDWGYISFSSKNDMYFDTEDSVINITSLNVTHKDSKATQKLTIDLITLEDMASIHFGKDPAELYKKTMWNLLYNSITNKTLVHCAAGIGRTGHLIAMLLFLQNFESIFEAEHHEIAAKRIHDIVKQMRKDRLCLISNDEQFEMAIRNAHELYVFGLRKGYTEKLKIQIAKQAYPEKLRTYQEQTFTLFQGARLKDTREEPCAIKKAFDENGETTDDFARNIQALKQVAEFLKPKTL